MPQPTGKARVTPADEVRAQLGRILPYTPDIAPANLALPTLFEAPRPRPGTKRSPAAPRSFTAAVRARKTT